MSDENNTQLPEVPETESKQPEENKTELPQLTRRKFLQQAGAVSAALVLASVLPDDGIKPAQASGMQASPSAVELAPRILPARLSNGTPNVFFQRTITYRYTGGPVTLASTPDGNGSL